MLISVEVIVTMIATVVGGTFFQSSRSDRENKEKDNSNEKDNYREKDDFNSKGIGIFTVVETLFLLFSFLILVAYMVPPILSVWQLEVITINVFFWHNIAPFISAIVYSLYIAWLVTIMYAGKSSH